VAVDGRVARRGERDDRGEPVLADDLDPDERLAEIVVRLGDDEVGAGFDRPANLLAVHLADDLTGAFGIVGVVRPGVADVAGEERTSLVRDLLRQLERVAVERLEVVLATDHPQLLPVPVVGERDHDLGPRAQKLPVQLADGIRIVEHDLWDEGAALEIAAPLELEEIALGAEDDVALEALQQGQPSVHWALR
jgi:hypothetical protein